MRKTAFGLFAAALAAFSLVSCDTLAGFFGINRILTAAELSDVILKTGSPSQPTPTDGPQAKTEATAVDSGSANFSCTSQDFYEAKGLYELLCLDPTTDSIWPGSILRAETILSGGFATITLARAPMNISVSLEGIQGSPARTIETPSLSSVTAAINDLMGQEVTGEVPAKMSADQKSVYSSAHLGLAINASVSWPGGNEVNESFNYDNTTVKTRYVMKFMQVYYSINIDPPATPGGFFVNVDSDLAATTFPSGSAPVYVSSVKYGRMVLFTVESSSTETDVKQALDAAYAGSVNVDAAIDVNYQKILENSHIVATVIGGSATDASGIITGGYDGLKPYITSGANYSKDSRGAPISYTLRFLKDNAVASIVLATDYTVRTYTRISQQVKVTLLNFHVGGASDEVGSGGDLEIYGAIGVHGTNSDGTTATGSNDSLWSAGSGSRVQVSGDSSYDIGASAVITFAKPLDNTNTYVMLSAQLYDYDSLSPDDDLGSSTTTIRLGEGFYNDSLALPKLVKESGDDVTVYFKIEPYGE